MAEDLRIARHFSFTPTDKGDALQSVERALSVLNLIARHPQGLTARQISCVLKLNISTCYHILNTLVMNGYLERLPGQQFYLLGPQIPFLNHSFVAALSNQEALMPSEGFMWPSGLFISQLVQLVRPILYRLTEEVEEPSYLGCWRYNEVVYMAIAETAQAPKIPEIYLGFQGPAHGQALGKVLLAYSDPVFVDKYLDMHPLTILGPNTIVQHQQFQEELNNIVRQGYAVDREEYGPDAYCIAVPIFAPRGEVVAGLALSFTAETFARYAERLVTLATKAAHQARAELRLSALGH
jgi:DNA-binding IclR family transcriptional regulator